MSEEALPRVELPDWVQQALRRPLAEEVVIQPRHRDRPEWPLLLEAAVVPAFLPRELAPGVTDPEVRQRAERALLRVSETTHAPEGVKWSLTRDTRRAVLQEAIASGEAPSALDRVLARTSDPVTRALRDCFTGLTAIDTGADLTTLEARRVAVSMVAGIPELTLPPLDALDRRVEFRRLVAQFERMVGRGRGGDRFFGRADERERLNAYVDVVGASGVGRTVQRVFSRAVRAVTGRAPLVVWGVGGVGKTTLLCKFMLEHVEASTSSGAPFPFVYLDFDRPTVSARNRAGLLMEMCAQIATQFDELAEPMAGLRTRLRATALQIAARPEGDSMDLLVPLAREFRHLVDEHLRRDESVLARERPFLLVLDTFEVVQYTRDDVIRMEEFVAALHPTPPGRGRPNDGRPWSRLRLIISGRQRLDDFLGEPEELPLRALDPVGSRDMLMQLADDASKSLSPRDAERLVAAVARAAGEPDGGVHPLRLRLIGSLFHQMGEPGSEIAHLLVEELQQPPDSRSITGQVLVDGVLVRRVLGHVGDARVRALADPGLVVRRITPEVIQQVMARGTPDPGAPPPEPGKADTRPAWELTLEQAEDIFKAFHREVSLVEPERRPPAGATPASTETVALRHRADVRLQMLPLIRARNRAQFERLHRLAFDFFQGAVRRNDRDWAALAEAIYHGLWLGIPLGDLDRMWPGDASFDPRIEANDFPDDSVQHLYLRAKGQQNLTAGELRRLPTDVGLTWLERRSRLLLGERRVDETVEMMRAIAGDQFEALDERPAIAALCARLLMRVGLWNDAMTLTLRHERRDQSAAWLSMARTRATIAAKSARAETGGHDLLDGSADSPVDVHILAELAAHMALARAGREESFLDLRETIADLARRGSMDYWLREQRILRLLIVTGGATPQQVAAYLQSTDRLPRDGQMASALVSVLVQSGVGLMGGEELPRIVLEMGALKPYDRAPVLDRLDAVWRERRQLLFENEERRLFAAVAAALVVAFDHGDWQLVLGNALTRELKRSAGELMQLLAGQHYVSHRSGEAAGDPDGVLVVQEAVRQGRLLALARDLTEWSPPEKGLGSRGYPQDVFGVARALVRWHGTIARLLGMTENGEPLA